MKYLILVLLLTGCGINGTQKVETNDSKQTIETRGEAFQYVVVRLEFISQIQTICENKYLVSDFENEALYRQAAAECTLENLSLLNISVPQLDAFNSQFCNDDANLDGLTPEEIQQLTNLCEVL